MYSDDNSSTLGTDDWDYDHYFEEDIEDDAPFLDSLIEIFDDGPYFDEYADLDDFDEYDGPYFD